MATLAPVGSDDAGPEVAAVYADIRAPRGTKFVNAFSRVLANDPALLAATWRRLKTVMVEGRAGGLDPLTNEMVDLAVSVANACPCCVHSHTAPARAKGMTAEQHAHLLAVLAMASQTDALATALGIAPDPEFEAG